MTFRHAISDTVPFYSFTPIIFIGVDINGQRDSNQLFGKQIKCREIYNVLDKQLSLKCIFCPISRGKRLIYFTSHFLFYALHVSRFDYEKHYQVIIIWTFVFPCSITYKISDAAQRVYNFYIVNDTTERNLPF